MSQGPTTPAGEPPRTAAVICREFAVGARARRLLDERISPGPFLAALIEARLHPDAIRFMAHALLNREAVWWACLCAREAAGTAPPADQRRALGAAVRWVIDPSEARRREAIEAGLAAGRRTPARPAALAASFASGDSDGAIGPAPASVNRVLAARHVAGSVLRSCTTGPAAEISSRYRLFLSLGLDVAYGNNRWT